MNKTEAQPAVLLFEDDLDLARQWAQALRELGVHVEHVWSVEAAEAACAETRFDVVVCDVFVQGPEGKFVPRGGYTLISYLRHPALEKTPTWGKGVPIIVVTGSPKAHGFDALAFAKGLGADVGLRKPLTPEALVMEVFAFLDAEPCG